jgi:hypothetical protein
MLGGFRRPFFDACRKPRGRRLESQCLPDGVRDFMGERVVRYRIGVGRGKYAPEALEFLFETRRH